jgi:hypothetical protein
MIKLAACCGYIKEWRWWKGTITRAVESPDWICRGIGLNVQIEVKAKLRRCLSARARKIIRRFSISASNHIRLEEFNRKISTTPPFLFLLRTPICLFGVTIFLNSVVCWRFTQKLPTIRRMLDFHKFNLCAAKETSYASFPLMLKLCLVCSNYWR